MSADVLPFPRAEGVPLVEPAATASALAPGQRVSHAYRWTWRGAWRLRVGTDPMPGYKLMMRACMAGLIQLIGRAETAHYLMSLAAEAGLCDGGNDNGPRAA